MLVLILILAPTIINCDSTLQAIEADPNISIISRVFNDVIEEFFVKENILFNFCFMNAYTEASLQIFEEFSRNNQKFKFWVQSLKVNFTILDVIIYRPTIFFLEKIEDVELFQSFMFTRYQHQPLKFMIFTPYLTYYQMETHWLLQAKSKITLMSGSIFHHSYFITNEEDTVSLSTVEWFSPKACNQAHMSRLNTFDKKSMSWGSKLQNYEKFLQYHGCELVLMVPAPVDGKELVYLSGIANVSRDQTEFTVTGIGPIVFGIASKVNNFTEAFQPVEITSNRTVLFSHDDVEFIPINGSYKVPQIFLHVDTVHGPNLNNIRLSNTFVNFNVHFVATPAEAYSPYEKLFLPFDLETWILLIATFISAFFVIFVINCSSKSMQQMIYGHNIETPFWNVIGIFFGVPQPRLPTELFPRFVLTIFVLFCLIFRTCYQNKMFEFMTSEPRRAPPKTIKDLIDRNYTVYSILNNFSYVIAESVKDGDGRRLDIYPTYDSVYFDILKTQSQNSSAKLALCVDQFLRNFYENATGMSINWNQLDEILYTSHEAFAFFQLSFFFRMFKKTIDRLIDTGVMKYLAENYYTKELKFVKHKSGPKVLSVDDLAFGFNIWLWVCCVSISAIVVELIVSRWQKDRKKIKFAKVHPIEIDSVNQKKKVNPETLMKFRVRNQATNIESNAEIDANLPRSGSELDDIEIDADSESARLQEKK